MLSKTQLIEMHTNAKRQLERLIGTVDTLEYLLSIYDQEAGEQSPANEPEAE